MLTVLARELSIIGRTKRVPLLAALTTAATEIILLGRAGFVAVSPPETVELA
jgi:hypothetical protein